MAVEEPSAAAGVELEHVELGQMEAEESLEADSRSRGSHRS